MGRIISGVCVYQYELIPADGEYVIINESGMVQRLQLEEGKSYMITVEELE